MCSAAMSFMFIMVDSIVTFCLFGNVLWKAERWPEVHLPIFGQTYEIQHLLLWISRRLRLARLERRRSRRRSPHRSAGEGRSSSVLTIVSAW